MYFSIDIHLNPQLSKCHIGADRKVLQSVVLLPHWTSSTPERLHV